MRLNREAWHWLETVVLVGLLVGLSVYLLHNVRLPTVGREAYARDKVDTSPTPKGKAKPSPQLPALNLYRIRGGVWHDADTLNKATVDGPWVMALQGVNCRAYGFDAWEVTRQRQTVDVSDEEVAKGKRALAALVALLDGAELYGRQPQGQPAFGAYSRLQVEFWLYHPSTGRWTSLAEWAAENGHTRPAPTKEKAP